MIYSEEMVVQSGASAYAEELLLQIKKDESFKEIFNRALKALEGYKYPGLVGVAHIKDYANTKIREFYPNDPQKEKIIAVAEELAKYLWNGVKPTSIKEMVEDGLK